MKTRITFLLLIVWSAIVPALAQSVSGEWYGVGNVGKEGNYSQYLSELILKQKGNKVSGEFNYYFKSAYLPSRVSGTYNSKTRVLELHLFPLLNFKAANVNGADCPMKGVFVLKVSKVETTLSGQFETTDHYKYTCPNIVLKFKKEIISPVEKKKFARQDATNKNPGDNEESTDSVKNLAGIKSQPIISKIVSPTTAEGSGISTTPITAPAAPLKKDTPVARINTAPEVDTNVAKKIDSSELKPIGDLVLKDTPRTVAKPLAIPDPNEAITKALNKRSFEDSRIIEVEADSIMLTMYDNGEVDGDTVALFLNRKLLLRDQRLSDKPIPLTVHIDTTVHEISMYAENLGSIPPNTALCIIMVDGKRYELILSSNYIRNGTIRFRKKTAAQIEKEKEFLK